MEEKKESWIETFIELLNEYEIEKEKTERIDVDEYVEFEWDCNNDYWLTRWDKTDPWEWDNLYWDTAVAYLISKSFWFIKWLVDNDKIDTSKANDKNLNGYEIELRIRAVKELVADSEEKTVLYLNLLMLLSINENPISFLISILK